MKEFVIYVEGIGFADEYTIKAKDLLRYLTNNI